MCAKTWLRSIACVVVSAGVWLIWATPVLEGQDFAVNSTADVADTNPGDRVCSTGATLTGQPGVAECTLRAAIQEANATKGSHKITLVAGTYNLTNSFPCVSSGGLHLHYCLTGQMQIAGAGSATTILDAGLLDRVLFIAPSAQVEISGVTIQHGNQQGGNYDGGGGGGISNHGKLVLSDSVLSFNTSSAGGGGLYNLGTLRVLRTTFNGNRGGTGGGGGLYNQGNLDVGDSTFKENTGDNGSAIVNLSGTATITGSTFSGNVSSGFQTGTLFLYQFNDPFRITTSITNSTIANNTGVGIAVGNSMSATLNNVTITGNSAGGLVDRVFSSNTFVRIRNTLISANPNGQSPDCVTNANTITSLGHNLIQNTAGCDVSGDTASNIIGTDPLLGVLGLNGGATETVGLQSGSPAIDAGSPDEPGTSAAACAAFDQRGFLRPLGAACDIGAFERSRGLAISGVTPGHGGNSGSSLVSITGNGFVEGAIAKLARSGQADIAGRSTSVDLAGSSMSQSFDLTGKAAGLWDIKVTNPDGSSATLPDIFKVEPPQSPRIWTQVVGQASARPGTAARYTVFYGNRGNSDAFAVPITISFPAGTQILLYTPVTAPPSQAGQVITNWSHAPVLVNPETSSVNVPLLIPVVPAALTGSFDIGLLIPTSAKHGDQFQFSVTHGDPFYSQTLDPTVETQMVAGALTYSQQVLHVTPPSAADANIKAYVDTQLSSIVEKGNSSLPLSQNSQSIIYSLGELLIDAGEYAASLVTPRLALAGTTSDGGLIGAAGPGGTPGGNPCNGGILVPGQTCGIGPEPVPDPNKPDKPFTAGDCRAIPHHHVSADGKVCLPDKGRSCAKLPNPFVPTDPDCTVIPIVDSVDPNDKSGARGLTVPGTGTHFVLPADPLPYTILFENEATASAAAQKVVITDQLDTGHFDLSTFSLGPIAFGSEVLHPTAGSTHFAGAVDLRPAQNLLVKIEAGLDSSTGVVSWTFSSLDPATGQVTTDPTAGFLPPNTNPPAGEGKVSFSLMAKSGVSSSSVICNRAKVVFDTNQPIETPAWCNSYDLTSPVSKVEALPASEAEPSFPVAWSGTDSGSGIASYNIYASDNNGTFALWQSATAAKSATFQGVPGHTYGFLSQSVDYVGNLEKLRSIADTQTAVGDSLHGPVVTKQPSKVSVQAGTLVIFSSAATGSPTPSTQWQSSTDGKNFVVIPGATSLTLSFTAKASQNGTYYRAVFTNTVGKATSSSALLTVAALPGDLNGDGVVNCADLAIVKSSFGKKSGQTGFDPRADVNHDDVVNVLDLSAVARLLPKGSTCK